MAECLLRAQLVSVANHVKARRSQVERAVTLLAEPIGVARILSGGVHFFPKKVDDLLLVVAPQNIPPI